MAREAGQQDQRARSPASLGGGRKRRLKGGLGEVGGAGARGFLAPTGSASSTGWVGLQIRQVACERRRRLGRRRKEDERIQGGRGCCLRGRLLRPTPSINHHLYTRNLYTNPRHASTRAAGPCAAVGSKPQPARYGQLKGREVLNPKNPSRRKPLSRPRPEHLSYSPARRLRRGTQSLGSGNVRGRRAPTNCSEGPRATGQAGNMRLPQNPAKSLGPRSKLRSSRFYGQGMKLKS